MTTATQLLGELRSAGVEVEARGDRLRLRGPRNVLTHERLVVLRQRKAELLAALAHDSDIPTPLVPAGWSPQHWADRLEYLSGLCRDLVPDRSKWLARWAAAVEGQSIT